MATPKAMSVEEVESETINDATLRAVIKAIQTNHWYDIDAQADNKFNRLYHCRSELSLNQNLNIIMKGDKSFFPRHYMRDLSPLRTVGIKAL